MQLKGTTAGYLSEGDKVKEPLPPSLSAATTDVCRRRCLELSFVASPLPPAPLPFPHFFLLVVMRFFADTLFWTVQIAHRPPASSSQVPLPARR